MRPGIRFAKLSLTAMVLLQTFYSVGCERGVRVAVDGNERGGRVSIDSPDFRLNAQGGPNGGRIDFNSPMANVHVSGRPDMNRGYNRPYPPYAPQAPAAPQSPTDPMATALPIDPAGSGIASDYSSPLPVDPATGLDPNLIASSAPAPSAPSDSEPRAMERFAAREKSTPDGGQRATLDPISLEEAASEVAMFDMINSVRQRNELVPVSGDRTLDVVARRHSEEMNSLDYFDHISPNPKNKKLTDRYRNDRVQYSKASENIAKFPYALGSDVKLSGTGRATAQTPAALARDMMEGYMNSPGHRANIVDPQVSKVGLGTVIGRRYAYNTQNFKD